MNIEAYDADSLRKMVRLLEYENKILKDKLKKAGISYEEVNPFEEKIESAEEYDLDQRESYCKSTVYYRENGNTFLFDVLGKRRCICQKRKERGLFFHSVQIVGMTGFCPKQRKEKVFCDECENTKWISLDVKNNCSFVRHKRRWIRCNRCISFIVKWYMQIYCI